MAARSVRGRVLLATVAVAAAGLLVAGIATYVLIRSFLVSRVDEQLRTAIVPVAHQLEDILGQGTTIGLAPPRDVLSPLGTYGAVVDPAGEVVIQRWFGYEPGTTPVAPDLPSGLPGSAAAPAERSRYLTVADVGGSTDVRVLALGLSGGGGTVVVGAPLTETGRTLGRLLVVEVTVAGVVLALIAGLALWLVRLGLRPLERMAETAGAIAGGDLSKRVSPADGSTEVGRLGLALNTMLGRIEDSFARRRAGEERLRRFVADASHELRSPITSIRGYAELFRRGAADRPEDLEAAMKRIEDEAARMGILVDDLLLLARLDEGLPLHPQRVDMAELVAEAVEAARAADPGRKIGLDAPHSAVVTGDGARLRQVLDNLLSNVRVHTPPGTDARVEVRTEDDFAVVEVSDRGPGVPPEARERLFERFFRADPSRARDRGGAGLGLAIATEIARAHGGRLLLWPSDEGATFRLEIPLASG